MKQCCDERVKFYVALKKIAQQLDEKEKDTMTASELAIAKILVDNLVGNWYHDEEHLPEKYRNL